MNVMDTVKSRQFYNLKHLVLILIYVAKDFLFPNVSLMDRHLVLSVN